MTMEMNETTEKKWSELELNALAAVKTAIDRGGDFDDSEKAAVKILGVAAKNRQTLTAREALRFNMAAMIADPEQLKRYISATAPKVQKALQSA